MSFRDYYIRTCHFFVADSNFFWWHARGCMHAWFVSFAAVLLWRWDAHHVILLHKGRRMILTIAMVFMVYGMRIWKKKKWVVLHKDIAAWCIMPSFLFFMWVDELRRQPFDSILFLSLTLLFTRPKGDDNQGWHVYALKIDPCRVGSRCANKSHCLVLPFYVEYFWIATSGSFNAHTHTHTHTTYPVFLSFSFYLSSTSPNPSLSLWLSWHLPLQVFFNDNTKAWFYSNL